MPICLAAQSAGEPLENPAAARLHASLGLDGYASPLAEEEASWSRSLDLSALTSRPRFSAAIRAHQRTGAWLTLRGHLSVRPGREVRLIVGDLRATWAAGALISAPEGFRRDRARHQLPPTGLPLRLQGTLARQAERQRGVLIARRAGRAQAALWILIRETVRPTADGDPSESSTPADPSGGPRAGVGLGFGMLSFALERELRAEPALRWSLALHPPWARHARVSPSGNAGGGPSTDAEDCAWVMEIAGGASAAGVRMQALAGEGRVIPARFLGIISGSFLWRDLDADPHGPGLDCWRLDWDLPAKRGIVGSLALLVARETTRGSVFPEIEHSSRLQLRAEPWMGCRLRASLSGTQQQRAGRDPLQPDRDALLLDRRNALEIRADLRLGARVNTVLRIRQSHSSGALAPAGIPTGWREFEEEPPTEGEADRHLDWDRGSGSLTSMRLGWQSPGGWWLQALLAATPASARLPAWVPVRHPPGRTVWRTVGRGRWLVEAVGGFRCRRASLECVVRCERAAETVGALRITILLGLTRRWG